jgi:hypothetical protein
MDDKASCFPSIRLLCVETGFSNRTVIDHLKIAEAAGWIRIELAGRGGQGWKRNLYTALIPQGSELPSPRLEGKGGEAGSPPSRERGESNDGNVVKELHTNSTKNSTNIYTDEFEQFWD